MNRKQRRAQGKTASAPAYSASADVQALFQRAFQHHRQGKLAEAEALYRQVLAADPRHPDALHMLGVLANQAGRHDLAAERLRQAIAVHPAFAPNHLGLGIALRGLGRPEAAAEAFQAAVRLDPANADARANLGNVLLSLGRAQEAEAALREAVRLRPGFAKAHNELGSALRAQGRAEESVVACRTALQLDPNSAAALANLGNALKDLGRAEGAIAVYDRALAVAPNMAVIHSNRGNALDDLGRLDEAIRNFDRAIALAPDFAEAHMHRALAMMASGDLPNGLAEYEWRKRLRMDVGASLAEPEWTGREDLAGRLLFIHSEQGLGDTIQFSRYASMAADRGARVALSVQPSLLSLMTGFDRRVSVIGEGVAPVGLDFHCALLSLPRAFGTTLASIPATPAPIRANAERAAAWRRRLGEEARPRVGLVWSGNALHINDRNRSIPLERLAPLLAVDAEWISLQKDVRERDRAAMAGLRDFAAELSDFAETAALIDALDLVVSVDTSVAHLAASMGKPTFILLPFSGDWRWMLGREDSPWYPAARLFRQPAPGDWPTAIARVAEAVRVFIDAKPLAKPLR